jgi:hypothetical protein
MAYRQNSTGIGDAPRTGIPLPTLIVSVLAGASMWAAFFVWVLM